MAEHRKPDYILYIVREGANKDDKSQWIRFAALWKASKGYSAKVEDSIRLYPPFNNPRVGLSLMPFEERGQRDSNDDDSDERPNRRGRGR